METLTFNVRLTTIHCGECGGSYAINERYRRQKEEQGGTWTCPYCKCGWGYVKSELDRAREQLQRTQTELRLANDRKEYYRNESEHFRRSRDGIKGVLTKVKRRVGKGTCPCCKRHFVNVERHMKVKHPTFADAEGGTGCNVTLPYA
jgi:hypothetical protein